MGCCLSLFFVSWIMKMYFHVFPIIVDNACKTQLCPTVLTPSAQAQLPLYLRYTGGENTLSTQATLSLWLSSPQALRQGEKNRCRFSVTSSLMLFNSVFDLKKQRYAIGSKQSQRLSGFSISVWNIADGMRMLVIINYIFDKNKIVNCMLWPKLNRGVHLSYCQIIKGLVPGRIIGRVALWR